MESLNLNRLVAALESAKKELADFQKSLEEVSKDLGGALEQMRIAFQDLPQSVKVLASSGWYLPFNFHPPTINRLAWEAQNGNVQTVDNEMISFLDPEIACLETELIKKFPHREKAITSAFRAHRNLEYYLSIPVFFAQTEGICKELTGKRFFKLRKGKPATYEWAANFNAGSILSMVVEPLRQTGLARKNQDLKNPIGINRHDVLHGDSTDYGENKVNSYKALSLLIFIGDTVYRAKEFSEKGRPNRSLGTQGF